MGNCCSSREKTTVQFENKEKFILNQVIERYSEINKDNSGQLSIDCY